MQALHASNVTATRTPSIRSHGSCARTNKICRKATSASFRYFISATKFVSSPSGRAIRAGRTSASIKAAAADVDSQEHLQLATARLPKDININGFLDSMYQWAATLTSSGSNLPFALPIKADKVDKGFEMSLLRVKDGRPMSVGDIRAHVEPIENQGDVLFVRFFEGPASGIDRQGPQISNSRERLQKNAEALIDIPIIMETMKKAIQKAVAQNKLKPGS